MVNAQMGAAIGLLPAPPPPILSIIRQHVEEAAFLRHQRTRLVRAPHVRLHLLARHDERIAAHLDGIAVAGETGREMSFAAEPQPGRGDVFVATLSAFAAQDETSLRRLVDASRESSSSTRMLISAVGWASAAELRRSARAWLASPDPYELALGLIACGLHQVDPGPSLRAESVASAFEFLAFHSMDVAARLARLDLLPACVDALDAGRTSQLQAAGAALLLGERRRSLDVLHEIAAKPGCDREEAIEWLFLALQPTSAQALLKSLAKEPALESALIRGAGLSGQAKFLPWLVEQCASAKHARRAGEALCLITGLDLDASGFSARRPEQSQARPSDNPADDDVSLDPDEDLPWPDAAKISAWLKTDGARFGSGVRWFCGAPLDTGQAVAVLRGGNQRQRCIAARHRSLLAPGAPLFNVAAPAWRQRRWLAALAI